MAKRKSKGEAKEITKIVRSGKNPRARILIGTATLGTIRFEWAAARYGQVIPTNWSSGQSIVGLNTLVPMGYLVAEAQNILAQAAIKEHYEWLFLHEDDVVLPLDCFLKLNKYMQKGDIPIISGLYYLKGEPSEPVVYRGRGNGAYGDFKIGEKVWADGIPTGCILIHTSILKALYEESEQYVAMNVPTRRIFESPRKVWFDPEKNKREAAIGTSDLYFCDRIMKDDIFKKAGWPKFSKKKHPYLVDTSLLCGHIDLRSGKVFPLNIGK